MRGSRNRGHLSRGGPQIERRKGRSGLASISHCHVRACQLPARLARSAPVRGCRHRRSRRGGHRVSSMLDRPQWRFRAGYARPRVAGFRRDGGSFASPRVERGESGDSARNPAARRAKTWRRPRSAGAARRHGQGNGSDGRPSIRVARGAGGRAGAICAARRPGCGSATLRAMGRRQARGDRARHRRSVRAPRSFRN